MPNHNLNQNSLGCIMAGLPRILDVKIALKRFSEPYVYYMGGEDRTAYQAVEILVSTSSPFPIKAVTPVIYIGEVEIPRYTTEGYNLYRFMEFEFNRLKPGAPIFIGWPYTPPLKFITEFRYQLGSELKT